MDTIFALSTPRGKSGVAIIRVSGADAADVCLRLAGEVPAARRFSLRAIRDLHGKVLDRGLVLFFPDQRSFTGEPVVEFHVHGSVAVIDALLEEIGKLHGLRAAKPGEFTKRALENEMLDLAQVESLADLIEAETEVQREQAMRGLSGKLEQKCDEWRSALIRALALLEATIDFADAEVPDDVIPEVLSLLDGVISDLEAEIKGVSVAERVREGFEIAIVGEPNVGKSTLLNHIAKRPAAIISDKPGTTRDVIELRMDLDGIPVTFLDTAGLRETEDEVEALGVDLARARAERADMRVFLERDRRSVDLSRRDDDIVVQAKGDLLPDDEDAISGLSGKGVTLLLDRIRDVLRNRIAHIGVSTRVRQKLAMSQGLDSLFKARLEIVNESWSAECLSEDIRFASGRLDFVVGRVGVEDVLDEIFSSFCLGK